MEQVDAALIVRLVGRHVVGADQVVDTAAGPADCRGDEVADGQSAHVRPDCLDLSKRLVSGHQEVVAGRCRAVFGRVDLLVGPIHPHADDLDQHPLPVRYLVDARRRQLFQVDTVRLPGIDGNGFH